MRVPRNHRFALVFFAAALPAAFAASQPSAADSNATVRVAAIQCYSRMGETSYNRDMLSGLIGQAVTGGARIVVIPECAVHGYMDPAQSKTWSSGTNRTEGQLDAWQTAETVPGPSTGYFGNLAKQLRIYLCIALMEKDENKLYNSQVLFGPEGQLLIHHRKTRLWTPGDGTWVSKGEKPVGTVDTPYGRIGVMICYEVHALPKLLAEAKADIVLYSVGWYGPNTENWYREIFPKRYVIPNNFAVVVANWSADADSAGWPGHGYSCVIDSRGTVLNMAKSTRGKEVIFADLPTRRKQ